jgi:hypothetical protein
MTVRDILEGYGIDFDSLTFKMKPENPEWVDSVWDSPEEEVQATKKMLEEDEIIINGEFIDDIDIVPDDPHGYIELYPESEVEDILAMRRG